MITKLKDRVLNVLKYSVPFLLVGLFIFGDFQSDNEAKKLKEAVDDIKKNSSVQTEILCTLILRTKVDLSKADITKLQEICRQEIRRLTPGDDEGDNSSSLPTSNNPNKNQNTKTNRGQDNQNTKPKQSQNPNDPDDPQNPEDPGPVRGLVDPVTECLNGPVGCIIN